MSPAAPPSEGGDLEELYEDLARWVWKRRGAAPAGEKLALRKRLRAAPEESSDLDAWILARHAWSREAAVLDLGSGFGGTLLRWAKERPARYFGVSASPFQVARAQEQASSLGLPQCSFAVRSFLDPLGGPFDFAVAIESLGHAADLRRTLEHLAGHLKPAGEALVIDDFAADASVAASPTARKLDAAWSGRKLITIEQFRELLPPTLEVETTTDLTALVPSSSAASRNLRDFGLGCAARLRPALRTVVRAFRGGLALEELYARGRARYLAIALRRRS